MRSQNGIVTYRVSNKSDSLVKKVRLETFQIASVGHVAVKWSCAGVSGTE